MQGKKLIVFLVTILMFSSGFINITGISVHVLKNPRENLFNLTKKSSPDFAPLGIGGWHIEATDEQDGKNFSDIYKIGGDGGGWEAPYDEVGVHMWAELNRVRAEYTFDVNDGPVKYVKYAIEYKDIGLFSDSPDALIYKWDDTWDTYSNIGNGHNPSYVWKEHVFNSNGDKYVNNRGEIRVAAQAYDDDNWWHQDNLAVKKIKISYRTADEEIYSVICSPYDTDADGSVDTVDVKIDADVGDTGDGTTVNVTAYCELVNPMGDIVDNDTITWRIIDHQVEYGVTNLTSIGDVNNGNYTVHIVLYDEYGNDEDETSEAVYLEPDPQRTITFYILPDDGGWVNFEGGTYGDNQTVQVSDGCYNVSANPAEYYVFEQWIYNGSININDGDVYSQSIKINVTGNGTLTACYRYIIHMVYFIVNPAESGTIFLDDISFQNGSSCLAMEGTYPLSAVPIQENYYFHYWATVGGIIVEDEYNASTNATINDDGVILAYFTRNKPPDKPYRPDGVVYGGVNTEYTYTSSTVDPDDDMVYYLFDWGDGTYSKWLGPYQSGETVTATHSWTGARAYEIKVKAKDQHNLESEWSDGLLITISESHPPTPPVITGSTTGKTKKEYEYTFKSTDLDGDQIYYYIDWDDGNVENWIGPYNSGENVKITHKWNKKGNYVIKALAKDTNGLVSSWGMLSVKMPRYRPALFTEKTLSFYPYLLFLIKKLYNNCKNTVTPPLDLDRNI
ncbi:MAG: hypothetical protein FE039_02025 [Thermoplasmata archaeon]|nr:MAG: hypothetical protein FE039_02025 [Thermoplasmata archaeon]